MIKGALSRMVRSGTIYFKLLTIFYRYSLVSELLFYPRNYLLDCAAPASAPQRGRQPSRPVFFGPRIDYDCSQNAKGFVMTAHLPLLPAAKKYLKP
jgi:hypothetical protein